MKRKRFRYWFEAGMALAGAAIIAINNLFIAGILPFLVPLINVIGGLVAILPPVLLVYTRYRIRKESERDFVSFLMDLSDSLNSGMTLPLALHQCTKRKYPALRKKVRKLSAQVDWGIPFDKALQTFAKDTRSDSIKRAVTTITETYRAGGRITDTLNSVTKSILAINKISEERKSSVYSQIMIIYIIFFVFIAILVVMDVMIFPSLPSVAVPGFMGNGMGSAPLPQKAMSEMLTYLIIIQGFFAGLVAGKMAEGSMVSGLKHSLFLAIAGYLIFATASQIEIPILSLGV